MQYNLSGSGQGIVQDVDYLCDTDITSYPQADKDRHANNWQDTIVVEILDSMDDWDFQGEIATHDLSANQQEYPFPTDVLKGKRVEVDYNGDGDFIPARPFDINEMPTRALGSSAQINAIFQQSSPRYSLFDNSLFLFPVPDTDNTSSLKIWYSENITTLTATTGGNTAEPAFARPFHRAISYGMSLDYARKYNLSELVSGMERALYGNTVTRKGRVGGILTAIRDFYSTRGHDKVLSLRSRYYKENYK